MKGFIKASVLAVCFCNLALPAFVSAKTIKDCDVVNQYKANQEVTRGQGIRVIDFPHSFTVELDATHRFNSGQLNARDFHSTPAGIYYSRQPDKNTGEISYFISTDEVSSYFYNCAY